jgi:ribosomal protein RSM22 (predicted rRNA methylase)
MTPALPADLAAALQAKLEGLSRHETATRAALISKSYRDGGTSEAIRSEIDALAYALVRMPATYAAVTASLEALAHIRPDFAPRTLLDLGAGPGTASFAAAEAFATLDRFALVDFNAALRALALELARGSAGLHDMTYQAGDVRGALAKSDAADLVVASYLIGELAPTEQRELAESMWAKCSDTLLVVEPGTPAGYARIIALRTQLVEAGAHVVAPCPHDKPCPLQAPDWCHFGQRLPRLRAHKEVKGVELPFEDEKFSYVALTRTRLAGRSARVLAQPRLSKVEVTAKLCTADGLVVARVPHRAKTAYAAARRWRWGDAVVEKG